MYHPTSRVLTVLELLQARGHMSGPELASRLEVDVRTVRRYIIMLQEIGIPIEVVIGRYGGYRLRPGFKLPPLMFTNDETLAITLGMLVVHKLGVNAMVPTAEGAIAKIMRVLPVHLRAQVEALQAALVISIHSPDELVERIVVETVSLAAKQGRQVLLHYRTRANEETERMLDPYGVVCHNGRWYTVGYCHLRQQTRVFRLDRVQAVEMRAETFSPPANFPLLEYIIQSFAAIPDTWDVEVLLLTSLEEARLKVPPGLATLEVAPCVQGVTLFTSIHDLNWMARFLIGLGCPFIIEQPAELRSALRELANEMIQIAQLTGTEDLLKQK
ncbi:MAG: YafY family transcriptional regulator [Ktedonobacteraceae bacterium]|nr:YafY family transcriptional regulator [Ktedonobacteraceae bacterium]